MNRSALGISMAFALALRVAATGSCFLGVSRITGSAGIATGTTFSTTWTGGVGWTCTRLVAGPSDGEGDAQAAKRAGEMMATKRFMSDPLITMCHKVSHTSARVRASGGGIAAPVEIMDRRASGVQVDQGFVRLPLRRCRKGRRHGVGRARLPILPDGFRPGGVIAVPFHRQHLREGHRDGLFRELVWCVVSRERVEALV